MVDWGKRIIQVCLYFLFLIPANVVGNAFVRQ